MLKTLTIDCKRGLNVLIKLTIKNILNQKANLKFVPVIFLCTLSFITSFYFTGCSAVTQKTMPKDYVADSANTDPEPNYDVTLDFTYQDFTSYLYIGNRVENFTAYFNTFFKASQDFDDAMTEYKTTLIFNFNRRLDSLDQLPPVSGSVKEKLDKAIERASKIIQFHKSSKFIDQAVLLIGKSYYYLTDYYNAERKFNEFLSKLSSSTLADEAILFLGRTKMRLGKTEEGIAIFKDLVEKSSDDEIKSLAYRDLGAYSYNKGNLEDAVKYFQASIDYSKDKERKAEGQFILAKIMSIYKPETAAEEYVDVLDYTSDYDLTFFSKLNYAKGLSYDKEYDKAEEVLTDLRKKYRDEPNYAQLVDLEIANNLFNQKDYIEAKEKYFEIIVKYPNTPVSADAYYTLAKYDEDVNNDYLNALVNYKKSVGESSASDYYKESFKKSATFEKYFNLMSEIKGETKITIPTSNAEVEAYRITYNEEKGLENSTVNGENKSGNEENKSGETPPPNEGEQGHGKGKPGGYKNHVSVFMFDDSLKNEEGNEPVKTEENNPVNDKGNQPMEKLPNPKKTQKENVKDSSTSKSTDSLMNKRAADSLEALSKEDKKFKAYYELAEIFMYDLNKTDSAEFYLKIMIDKFPEPDKKVKALYTLGTLYKNNNMKSESDAIFSKIISDYPNTVYSLESKKIMGITTSEADVVENPINSMFKQALNLFNDNKYQEAVSVLEDIENKFPKDTLVAKSLYSIGWIYENKLINKDSSIAYYKKLKEKFPESEYARKVSPLLEYIASLDVKENSDSTKANPNPTDTTSNGEVHVGNKEENPEEVKEKNAEEVKPDSTNINGENRLSPEEIEKLLKEGGEETNPPK